MPDSSYFKILETTVGEFICDALRAIRTKKHRNVVVVADDSLNSGDLGIDRQTRMALGKIGHGLLAQRLPKSRSVGNRFTADISGRGRHCTFGPGQAYIEMPGAPHCSG